MKTQKSILVLALLNLCFLPALFAQEKFDLRESRQKHEISIGFADLFTKPAGTYFPYYGYDMVEYYNSDLAYIPYYPYNATNSPKLALRYKYNFGKLGLRAGADFLYQDQKSGDDDSSADNNKTKIGYGSFKLGAELHTNFRRVQLYYGLDIYYTLSKTKYEYTWQQNGAGGQIVWITNTYSFSRTEYGGAPFIGIKYFINENLSLGVETSYSVGYYKVESESKYGEPSDSYKNWIEGTHARFGPIGILSLNIHF